MGTTRDLISFSSRPEFQEPCLIAAFSEDAGRVAPRVIDYLNRQTGGERFCEIELEYFFALGGVVVENNIAQFPESGFYFGERKDLVVFKGNEPQFDRYRFLQTILDVAEHYCGAKELYTIGGAFSPVAHTIPRRLMAVFNRPEFQKRLRGYGLDNMDWEGPAALNSFLLWTAERRNIQGASLWLGIPFYLAAVGDPGAEKRVLEFFDTRFDLGIDFTEINEAVAEQNEKIARLRSNSAEVNDYIEKLEVNLSLTNEEGEKLVNEVAEFLER